MYHVLRIHVLSSYQMLLLFFGLLLLAACDSGSTAALSSKSTLIPARDFYGTSIPFSQAAPQRIVSLTAGTSEMLGALHLEHRVVAVDFYTDFPPALTSLPRVSNGNGVYNIEQIVALKPDLVLSWGGETEQYDG